MGTRRSLRPWNGSFEVGPLPGAQHGRIVRGARRPEAARRREPAQALRRAEPAAEAGAGEGGARVAGRLGRSAERLERGLVVDDAALLGLLVEVPERGGGLDVAAGGWGGGGGVRGGAPARPQARGVTCPRGLRLYRADVRRQHQLRLRGRRARSRQRIAGGLGVHRRRGVDLVGPAAGLVRLVRRRQRLGRPMVLDDAAPAATTRRRRVAGPVADEVRPGLLGRGRSLDGLLAVVDLDDRGAHLDHRPLGDQQGPDGAGERRRELDQRLRRLDLDQHVVDLDDVTLGDPPGDDLGLEQALARVRQQVLALHNSPQ